MANRALQGFVERARCAKHNLLDRAPFSIHYSGGMYRVRTFARQTLLFPSNPYLALIEIFEGYLRGGTWRLEPGMTVIDAGACRGEFALYAARCVGLAGRVIVLEPDPANMKSLVETFHANGGVPSHVTLLTQGLWKQSGRLSFAAGNTATSALILDDRGPTCSDQSISIDVRSLPDLVENEGAGRLDFVKMDVEGAEVEAVEGALPLLATHRARFAIASYHLRDGRHTADTLERQFQGAGYRVETSFPRHLTTYAWPAGEA